MVMQRKITVEVAYANACEQAMITLQVAVNTTVIEAIIQSGILDRFAEIDLQKNRIGIFGNKVTRDVLLKEGDRIEIYHNLLISPVAARKSRAIRQKAGTSK